MSHTDTNAAGSQHTIVEPIPFLKLGQNQSDLAFVHFLLLNRLGQIRIKGLTDYVERLQSLRF